MSKRIDLLCVAKNENLTIKDWVNYHLNMGFNRIWIVDNNDVEDVSLIDTLNDELATERVFIINNFKGAKTFQLKAYNAFINYFSERNMYDWIGIIDCDEYFDYNHEKYKSLSEYFETVEEKCPNITGLFVNWQVYDDNGQYYYKNEPVVERFPNPADRKIPFWNGDDENTHIKSFIRGKGQYIGNPHNCVTTGKTYSADFKELNPFSPWNSDYSFDNAKIKHYVTKSLEEFIMRKMGAICADNENNKPYNLEYYWRVNKKTDEALKALADLKEKYKLENVE